MCPVLSERLHVVYSPGRLVHAPLCGAQRWVGALPSRDEALFYKSHRTLFAAAARPFLAEETTVYAIGTHGPVTGCRYRIYYDQVMKEVHRYDFLIDRLVLADCAMLSGRDDNYFVFEDVLKEVLLAFLRDTAVLQMYPNPR